MAFEHLLDQFSNVRALVIGDVMLDEYIVGTVDRISPEAPVMVVRKQSCRTVPGGAANVAKNVTALGAEAVVAGVIGADEGGALLRRSIEEISGLRESLLIDDARATTRKTRVVANHAHQVLRIDEECADPLGAGVVKSAIRQWGQQLDESDVLILSDYAKGVLTESMVGPLIELATQRNLPVLANVKPISAHWYRGASLISVNRAEASAILGRSPGDPLEAVHAAHQLMTELGVQGVLITLGDQGMVGVWNGGEVVVPAVSVEAYDVAGAGDTVLATIALGAAVEALGRDHFALAAQTSAKVVQHVGVAVPTQEDLREIRSLND